MDGLPVEFYSFFRNIIENPLFEMLKECINNEEMATTMKQGIITLLPKSEKDHLLLDNWRPKTLLNVDYKILSLIFARRLRKGLSEIINETQTGFMTDYRISCNIRFILDLIDYSQYVDSDTLILFLDFYKAFNSVEHQFLFNPLVLVKCLSPISKCFIKIPVVVSCYSQIPPKDFQLAGRSIKAVPALHFSFL